MELRREEKKGRFQVEKLERRIAPCSCGGLPGLSTTAGVQGGPGGAAANLQANAAGGQLGVNATCTTCAQG